MEDSSLISMGCWIRCCCCWFPLAPLLTMRLVVVAEGSCFIWLSAIDGRCCWTSPVLVVFLRPLPLQHFGLQNKKWSLLNQIFKKRKRRKRRKKSAAAAVTWSLLLDIWIPINIGLCVRLLLGLAELYNTIGPTLRKSVRNELQQLLRTSSCLLVVCLGWCCPYSFLSKRDKTRHTHLASIYRPRFGPL